MITRIGHMAIRARDIEATARFYSEILEMREAFRMHNGPGGALSSIHMYVAPSQYIEIFPGGVETSSDDPQKTAGHLHMCYEVSDIEAAFDKIRKKGITIDKELKQSGTRCFQFWISDPDGNSIEIIQLTEDSMQMEANRRVALEQA